MILLLDIGGTTTRVSSATKTGALLPVQHFPTEPDAAAGIARIAHASRAVLERRSLKAIVAGIAGQVSKEGVLLRGPNLPGWEGKNIRELFEKEFSVPSFVVNDAVLGGMGEAHAGAGKGAHSLLYMTLGTGIGVSRIIDGVPDFSIGTETGHQFLIVDGVPTEAENLVSGKAIRKRYGKPGEEIHDPAIWKECARYAALTLHNTMLFLLPDKIVIGGSLVKDGSLPVEDIELRLAELSRNPRALPEVAHGTLGESAGLHGAQAYARIVLK